MRYNVLRRLFQVTTFTLFIIQYPLHSLGVYLVVGSLLSSNVLKIVSFADLFAVMEKFIAYKTILVIPISAVLTTFITYLLLGRIFCGWICPLDIYYSVSRRRKNIQSSTNNDVKLESDYLGKVFFMISIAILSIFLLVSSTLAFPLFTNYAYVLNMLSIIMVRISRIIAFGNIVIERLDYVITFIVITLIIDLALATRFPRFWCRRLCPAGLIYGLLNKLSPLTIKINIDKCTKCGICDLVCPTNIYITSRYIERKQQSLRDVDCIKCFKCIDNCPTKALAIAFTKP